MRFTSSRAALADALSLVSDVIPNRSAKPVLQNVRIQGNDDGTITLSGTDLEIGLCYRMPVDDLTDPCSSLLPASRFAGIMRDDWASTVTVSIEEDRAEISTENGTFHLVGNAGEDFPSISEMPEENVVEISGADFADAIRKTSFACARGDTRYALNGILVHMEGKDIEFVASDTHRLSLSRKKSRSEAKKGEAIVITKGLTTLARMAEDEETVRLHLATHELIAETSNGTLVTRLVDGQFPRYREVIPRDLETKVTVNRELLIKTLRLAGQVTNEETHSMVFAVVGDKVQLNATGSESGDARVELPAEVTGENVSASFNYVYLTDALKALDCETVTWQFRDPQSPVRMDVDDFTHIIMPIRPRDV